MKLSRRFYNRETLTVAKKLLGKVLVHEFNGEKISGKIVEVEAYKGIADKAAHSYRGRKTKRVEAMYGESGHAYVYFIYGMYNCMNVVTREKGVPQAVLIRAVEPLEGLDTMSMNRYNKLYKDLSKKQIRNLTSGPGKLCIALSIDRTLDKQDLCGNILYIEERENNNNNFEIIESKRIGIDYAEEAKDYLWRFYIKNNPFVSKYMLSFCIYLKSFNFKWM